MIGVYTYGEEKLSNIDYSLFYTLKLPVTPFKKEIDIQKDIIDKINWHKPYRQWLIDTDDFISREYQDFIKDQGLKLMTKTLMFGLQEGHTGYRHRDIHVHKHWHWGNPYNAASINYLLTPATGTLDFWDLKEGGEFLDTETDTQYEIGLEHEHSKILTSWTGQDNRAPVLIRTEAVHQATNLVGPGPRVTLTLRFELNPIWWMARCAFMPYVISSY